MAKTNPYRRLRSPRFAPLAGFSGDTVERGPLANFKIGLCVGRREKNAMRGARTRGVCVPYQKALDELVRLRVRQVGRQNAGASALPVGSGVWRGGSEPTLDTTIIWDRTPRERTERVFKRNMVRLGEQIAERLGQREVIVVIDGERHRVNAPHRRGPRPNTPRGSRVR